MSVAVILAIVALVFGIIAVIEAQIALAAIHLVGLL